jgi:hypothetical protein
MAGRREIDDLKPIDKAVLGAVSESPGRSASERVGSLETIKLRRPRRLSCAEAITDHRKLAEAMVRSGGVVATAR